MKSHFCVKKCNYVSNLHNNQSRPNPVQLYSHGGGELQQLRHREASVQ